MAVHFAVDRAIATITLDNPDNRNALSKELVAAVDAHLSAAAARADVRAIVITHTGRTFCAGADLKEQAGEGGPGEGTKRMLGLLRAIVEVPKPVIARIDGHVRAGGIGIVGACDIVIAGPASTFAFTEARLGLAPAIISLTTRGRMTDRAVSRYWLTGETFNATTAAAVGLVTVATDDVDGELDTVCDALRACSPQGLAETKPLTTASTAGRFADGADAMQALSQRLFESEEAREGMLSFLEKRPARWVPT